MKVFKNAGVLFIATLFLMALITSAYADSFSVRGNIRFFDKKADIIAYEDSQGSTLDLQPEGKDHYTSNCIVAKGISFAGYSDVDVAYYFNDNDELISIIYVITRTATQGGETLVTEIYNRLNNALDKYGSSINSNDALTLEKDQNGYGVIEWYKSLGFFASYIDYGQRVADVGNGYAEIQIISARYLDTDEMSERLFDQNYSSSDGDKYSVAISYTFIETEVVQAIIDTINQAESALDSDL